MLSSFKLYDYIDYIVANDKRLSVGSRYSVWPTDCSVVATMNGYKKVVGSCHRAMYYRMKKVKATNPFSPYIQYVMELGKQIEYMHIEKIKQAGLYRVNNLKFWLEELQMSGEIDLVSGIPSDPDKIVIVELKTSYGYSAETEIIGNSKNAGAPKPAHIMQVASYLYAFRDNPKIIGGKILYFLRDNTKHREFNIHLEEKEGVWYIFIDGQMFMDFTYTEVMARFTTFHKMFEKGQLPDRDYSLVYTDEEMEVAYAIGDITEKAYTTFKAKPIPSNRKGDWLCNGCLFKDKCYSDNPGV